MLAEPFAVLGAERPVGQGEQHLLAHNITEREPAGTIIPDFGLFFGDSSLAGVRIGVFRPKDKVKVAGEVLRNGVEAAGALDREVAPVAGAETDVFDNLLVATMLDQKVGAAFDGDGAGLDEAVGVVEDAGWEVDLDLEGFLVQIGGRDEGGHGVIFSRRRAPLCQPTGGAGRGTSHASGEAGAGRRDGSGGEKEADGGDAGGAGGEGVGGVGGGEAAEGEDGGEVGEADGFGQGGEAERGVDGGAADDFAEDGAEEEEVRLGGTDGGNFGRGVDGGGKNRRGEAGGGEAGAGTGGEGGGEGGGEVEAIETGGKGEVEKGLRGEGLMAEVEEEAREGAGRDGVAEGVGDGEKVGEGEILFAELQEIDAEMLEMAGKVKERRD